MRAKTIVGTGQMAESSERGIRAVFNQEGATRDGVVEVNISYDIIRQFSAQLYTNPRKAIEELVCNSYDAGAKECWVKIPKENDDSLFVLDNGVSMDLNGLKDLWKVAVSPKVHNDKPRIDNGRMQIGKFGVGKLAVFALGARLTHIACVKGNVRIVSVSQSEIKEQPSGKRPTFEVYRMPLEKAKSLLEPYFKDFPRPWEKGWKSWTLAIIGEIEQQGVGRALKVGVLKQMITSSLPISSDFKVHVEKDLVPPRKIDPTDIEVEVNVINVEFRKKVKESLQAYWQDVLGKEAIEAVPREYYEVKVKDVQNPRNVSEFVKGIVVPKLGAITGKALIAKNRLTTPKLEERGYTNNGFAIYANGRLINPEDELFGITQRSHRYWIKFHANVEVPGLDKVLLVQRNQLSENSVETQVARVVMRTLFNFTRNKAEQIEGKEEYQPPEFGTRLKMLAPLLVAQAFRGLTKEALPKKGLDKLAIDFATLGEDSSAARYDPDIAKILVNEDHPLIEALDDFDKSKNLRHMIGEVLAGVEMSKGYLTIKGVDKGVTEDTGEIIEVALRSAASFVKSEVEEHIKAIEDASYEGGRPFENAVVIAFRSLRISAKRAGGADEPDGILEILKSGTESLRISVEAKGSGGCDNPQRAQ